MTRPYIKDITTCLEDWAPLAYQENYDNSGLLVGNQDDQVTGILLTLDVLPTVIEEAKTQNCNLIIAHHPIIFKGLKKLNGTNYVEKVVIEAIKNDIAIYAIHTNLDNIQTGVNNKIAQKLGLKNIKILSPKSNTLLKLCTMVPVDHVNQVTEALARAGAGNIGNYSHCSFRVKGEGFFKPNSSAKPYIGKSGNLEKAEEIEITVILPQYLKDTIFLTLTKAHPYEEIAYFFEPLINQNLEVGSGILGTLQKAMDKSTFLKHLKKSMNLTCIRHTKILEKEILRVAICGGSGSFLLKKAIQKQADVFITADFKYHEFFDAEDKIMIADIGHYESEVFTKDLLEDYLKENFCNDFLEKNQKIKLLKSQINTNPIDYFV